MASRRRRRRPIREAIARIAPISPVPADGVYAHAARMNSIINSLPDPWDRAAFSVDLSEAPWGPLYIALAFCDWFIDADDRLRRTAYERGWPDVPSRALRLKVEGLRAATVAELEWVKRKQPGSPGRPLVIRRSLQEREGIRQEYDQRMRGAKGAREKILDELVLKHGYSGRKSLEDDIFSAELDQPPLITASHEELMQWFREHRGRAGKKKRVFRESCGQIHERGVRVAG